MPHFDIWGCWKCSNSASFHFLCLLVCYLVVLTHYYIIIVGLVDLPPLQGFIVFVISTRGLAPPSVFCHPFGVVVVSCLCRSGGLRTPSVVCHPFGVVANGQQLTAKVLPLPWEGRGGVFKFPVPKHGVFAFAKPGPSQALGVSG